MIGGGAGSGNSERRPLEVPFHADVAGRRIVHQLGHHKGMHPVFALFINRTVIVVPCGHTTTCGSQNNTGFRSQFTRKRQAGLRDGFFGCRQCELGETVIKRHLLAVISPLCLEPAHLSANLDLQPFNIAKRQLADATNPIAHRLQGRRYGMPQGIDRPCTGDHHTFHRPSPVRLSAARCL